jgi:hypothetical protein
MPDAPTTGALLRAGRLFDDDVHAAVSAHLADPKPGPRLIAKGVTVDVAAAVAASEWAARILEEDMSEAVRRMAVRTAILLVRAG